MKFHFDCVFYYVSDLERSIRFYRDVLGLKFVSRDIVARFDIDGVLFEVVPAPDKGVLHQAGNARLCLRVDNVEEALKELQAKSVHTGKAESQGTGKLGSFEDPDGNEICLWEYFAGRNESSTVDLEVNDDGHAFKQQPDFKRRRYRQGMQAIVVAGNYCGRGEHAAFRQAGNLILEVARYHIADFAERVGHL